MGFRIETPCAFPWVELLAHSYFMKLKTRPGVGPPAMGRWCRGPLGLASRLVGATGRDVVEGPRVMLGRWLSAPNKLFRMSAGWKNFQEASRLFQARPSLPFMLMASL